jgi:hypothetical protein
MADVGPEHRLQDRAEGIDAIGERPRDRGVVGFAAEEEAIELR